tara:strand:- start:6371 stop:8164 length:1794 start_codon:yes stop_codon:yes gene_type:complete
MVQNNPERERQELLDAIEELTRSVETNSEKLDDAVTKQVSSRKKEGDKRRKLLETNNTLARIQNLNTLKLGGVIAGMFSLKGMLGIVRSSNADLVKSLAQAGQLTRQQYSDTLGVFEKNNVSMTQAVAAIGEVVGMGMSRFGNEVKLMAGQMKVLGVQNKGLLQNIRFNSEVLGFSVESSRLFAESMVSSARKMGTSIEGLVGAVNSMKSAITNVAAELGPTTARSVQVAAAMLSQGNNEMQAMLTEFMTSTLAGPSGFMKAGFLGQTMQVGMSPDAMAAATVSMLQQVGNMAGRPGPGTQHMMAAMEQANIFTRQDVVLSRMMGKDIKKLTESNLKQAVAQVGRASFEQAWQNALFDVQKFAMEALTGIAAATDKFGGIIPKIALIATAISMVASSAIGIAKVGVLTFRAIVGIFSFIKAQGLMRAAQVGISTGGHALGAGTAGALAGRAATFSPALLAGTIIRFMGVAGLVVGAGMLAKKLFTSGPDIAQGLASASIGSMLSTDFMDDFGKQREESKKQRQEMIKIQEEQLGLMKGSLSNNPSENPLNHLTAELTRNMLGINTLVELAGERTDLARQSMSSPFKGTPIGILKPGG